MSARVLTTPRPVGGVEPTYVRVGDGDGVEVSDEEPAHVNTGGWRDLVNVKSDTFHSVMGLVIILNAALMGLETDFGEEHFTVLEHIFCWIYITELAMNLGQIGCRHFKDPSNLFDLVLVGVGSLDLYVLPHFMAAPQKDTSGHAKSGTGNIASLLRLLRMMRILRVLRLFKMFKSLAVIMTAFIRAINIVMWVGLLTIIIDYVCAIFLTRTVGHRAKMWGAHEQEVLQWFGTIPRSMRTLFIIMTLAEWDVIALTLCEQMPALLVFAFFIFYIMVASYTMVSLITGILSECLSQAQEEEQRNKLDEYKEEREAICEILRKTFKAFDTDMDTTLSVEELARAARSQRFLDQLAELNILMTQTEFLEIVNCFEDGKGRITVDAFVEAMGSISGSAKATTAFHILHRGKGTLDKVTSLGRRVDEMHARQDVISRKVDQLTELTRRAISKNGYPLDSEAWAKSPADMHDSGGGDELWKHLGNTRP